MLKPNIRQIIGMDQFDVFQKTALVHKLPKFVI